MYNRRKTEYDLIGKASNASEFVWVWGKLEVYELVWGSGFIVYDSMDSGIPAWVYLNFTIACIAVKLKVKYVHRALSGAGNIW